MTGSAVHRVDDHLGPGDPGRPSSAADDVATQLVAPGATRSSSLG